jgi:hypothetical protein
VTQVFALAPAKEIAVAPAQTCGRNAAKVVNLRMPRTGAAQRYLIEIKDAKGSIVFSAVACWDDKDKRLALAQIERLAQLPEVNFDTGPAHEPESGTSKRRPRPRMVRLRREP